MPFSALPHDVCHLLLATALETESLSLSDEQAPDLRVIFPLFGRLRLVSHAWQDSAWSFLLRHTIIRTDASFRWLLSALAQDPSRANLVKSLKLDMSLDRGLWPRRNLWYQCGPTISTFLPSIQIDTQIPRLASLFPHLEHLHLARAFDLSFDSPFTPTAASPLLRSLHLPIERLEDLSLLNHPSFQQITHLSIAVLRPSKSLSAIGIFFALPKSIRALEIGLPTPYGGEGWLDIAPLACSPLAPPELEEITLRNVRSIDEAVAHLRALVLDRDGLPLRRLAMHLATPGQPPRMGTDAANPASSSTQMEEALAELKLRPEDVFKAGSPILEFGGGVWGGGAGEAVAVVA